MSATLSRGRFLAGTTGAAVGLGAWAIPAGAAVSNGDISILNYALLLEELQAAFYTEAERGKALSGDSLEAVEVIGGGERAPVKALREVLGGKAIKAPFFNFKGTTEDPDAFLRTAVAFEDLAVAAYKGQAPLIRSPEVLAAAISIHSVEARHAAWIRYLAGSVPATDALDAPLTRAKTMDIVNATGFVVAPPKTTTSRKPKYTG
jgi:Ferritin-like domain